MSNQKSPVDDAIDRLEEADDWEEDSQVNVHVHAPPPKSSRPASKTGLLEAFALLPPWGRVVVVLAILGVATAAGLAGKLLSAVVP